MSDHDEKKDPEKKEEGALSVQRRSFLKTLMVMGGGGLVYGAPLIKALEGRAFAQTSNAINVTLPASYAVNEPNLVFDIAVDDGSGATLSVAFTAVGGVTLSQTTNPNVARVSLDSLNLRSNDLNPLLALGYDAGLITASVPPNTSIGTLDLSTGTLAENDFPLGIAFERNFDPWSTGVLPTAALIVQQVTAVSPTPAQTRQAQQQQPSSGKCTKKNDVDVPLPGGPGKPRALPPGKGKGKIGVGMKPKAIKGEIDKQPIQQAPGQPAQ